MDRGGCLDVELVYLPAVNYFLRLDAHFLPVGSERSLFSVSCSETDQRSDYRNLRNVLDLIKYRNSAYSPASSVFGTRPWDSYR